jgi:hypothetical protein
VNLTSLLVLTTLFISVSNSLPKTSYIKLIDIWLIVSLLIPFTEVILHTVRDVIRNDNDQQQSTMKICNCVICTTKCPKNTVQAWQEHEEKTKREMRELALKTVAVIGKLGLPLVFALFCVLFFAYGFLASKVRSD